LAAHQFVLTNKAPTPNSVGHRSWHFKRPSGAIHMFWDGRERELVVELRQPESPTPVRKRIAAFGIELGSPPDCYPRVLDGLLEVINAAVRADS
jgi:hypothetical protein